MIEKVLSVSNQNLSLVKLHSKNSKSVSKHYYLYGTKKIEYFVFRTRRRKTSEIIVDSDEIVIRVPYSKSLSEIQSLIKVKITWILRKQKEISDNEKKIEVSKPVYTEDSTLPYLGKDYRFEVKILDSQKENSKGKEKNSVVYKNGVFVFGIHSDIPHKEDYNEEIKKLH